MTISKDHKFLPGQLVAFDEPAKVIFMLLKERPPHNNWKVLRLPDNIIDSLNVSFMCGLMHVLDVDDQT